MMNRLLPGISMCLLLTACTTTGTGEPGKPLKAHLAELGYRQAEAVGEIARFDIDGWQYVDKQHLILGPGTGPAYLVTFNRPCRNLAYSNTLGYTSTIGLLTRHDRILSSDGVGFTEQCLVEKMYRLDKR